MPDKILIIFNPKAGKKYQGFFKERFLKILEKIDPETPSDWLAASADIGRQLSGINFAPYKKIIAIGGDGTIRAVAEFLLKNNINLPLGIIPQGSANILASNLNLPFSLKNSIKTACLGKEKKIDVGLINKNRYFLTCLSLGHGSSVIKEADASLKIRWGLLAYVWIFFKRQKKYLTDFKFIIDGNLREIRGNTMIIANAFSIFKIKPLVPVDFADGLMEIIILKASGFVSLAISLLSFLSGGKTFPFLYKIKGKKITVVKTDDNCDAQIDGEDFEFDQDLTVEIIPQKLKVMVLN